MPDDLDDFNRAMDANRPGARAPVRVVHDAEGGEDLAQTLPPPVTPLGHLDGVHYFFDPRGQVRALNAQQLGQRGHLDVLFCGHIAWAAAVAPAVDKEGNTIPGDYSQKGVARLLIRLNDGVGLFTDRPRRGPGVWRSSGGVPMLHLGDVVVALREGGATEKRAGFSASNALWPAHPAVLPVADGAERIAWLRDPAGAQDCARLLDELRRWNWGPLPQADVFFGLWAAHLLGAALRWRSHGLLVGPPGSGKSTLLEFYQAISPLAVMLNDFTEAGLRQMLTGRAQPLLLDEAEGESEAGAVSRMQRVVELLRRASGGQGAQSVRGSAGGQSQRFEVMSPAMLGAVLPPVLLPQDATRITRLDLRPRAPEGPGLPSAAELAAWKALAPRLWGRALAGLGRVEANIATYRDVLIARGCAPRLADQIGTILAARKMMLEDEPVAHADADEDVAAFGWLAPTEADQVADAGPMACLTHLLQSAIDANLNGERPTVGQMIRQGYADDGDRARRLLAEHGLLLAPWPRKGGGDAWLYIADKHPRLGRLFEGTQWASGRWKEDLRRLAGAEVPDTPQWIGEAKPRCCVVPPALLPEREQHGPAGFTVLEELAGEFGLGQDWAFQAAKARLSPKQARTDAEQTARARASPRPG